MTDKYGVEIPAGNVLFQQSKSPAVLIFFDVVNGSTTGNSELGRLVNENGMLTFTGNTDASARVLFDGVVALNNTRMKQLELGLKTIQKFIEEYESVSLVPHTALTAHLKSVIARSLGE